MTDTEFRRLERVRVPEAVPDDIARLERSLVAAFHAFDDIDRMSMPHRSRVVNEVTAAVPDAASAAARAGHAEWALAVVRSAAGRRPAWSSICTRWEAMIATSLEVIEVVGALA